VRTVVAKAIDGLRMLVVGIISAMVGCVFIFFWVTFASPLVNALEHRRKGEIGHTIAFLTIGSWPLWVTAWVFLLRPN